MSERFRVEQVKGQWSVVDSELGRHSPFSSIGKTSAEGACSKFQSDPDAIDKYGWHDLPKVLQVDYLNLSKPCEAFVDGKWVPVVGVPVHNRCKDDPFYGCFVEDNSGILRLKWRQAGQDIRNVRDLRYETHTMETLLPLANEWIVNTVTGRLYRINGISRSDVLIGNDWISFLGLLKGFTWATGPHAGEPVAREVT